MIKPTAMQAPPSSVDPKRKLKGMLARIFSDTTVEALSAGLTRAAATTWDSARIRRHAERFSRQRFVRDIERVVDETLSAPAGRRW